ncbi:uncharacterized protein LOC108657110 [Drosophila navojoa]|nr:uncharacterized protein LOC108657110 [Drosophila navojoa]
MGFVPQQQPFSGYQDQSAPYYPYGQAPYYGYMGNGPNMAYMPPGQQQQGFYPGMSDYNHMNPPYDQAYWDQQANANSIPYGGHPMQPRHVYVNGALYNADLVEPPVDFGRPPPEFGPNNSLLETEDDSYDPMDPVMPTIYGIRFYNPNNGPDGAIPPRAPKKRKCSHNMYMNSWQPSKAANYFGQGMPWYNNAYPPVPYNNLPTGGNFPNYTYDNSNGTANNNRSQLAPEMPMGSSAGTNAGGSATTSATGQNFIPILSPSSKTKRRQGRSRPRGYIQSFGIVAPLSHNNNGTKNSAGDAKANVPAAAEKKSPAKKVENSDANDLTLKWPLPAEGNKPDQKS